MLRPPKLIGLYRPLLVMLPGLAVTVKAVMGLPPLAPGAVNCIVAVPPFIVALALVGEPGTVIGVTAFEGPERGPLPAIVVANTLNV